MNKIIKALAASSLICFSTWASADDHANEKGSGGNVDVLNVVLVVHAEPISNNSNPTKIFPNLKQLVADATLSGQKLTILMTDAWYQYFIDTKASTLPILEQWINNGHVIGWHHHDYTHMIPDGNCALTLEETKAYIKKGLLDGDHIKMRTGDCPADADIDPSINIGTMRDIEAELASVLANHANGNFNVATQGTDPDLRNFEWQPGINYSSGSSDYVQITNNVDFSRFEHNKPAVPFTNPIVGWDCKNYNSYSVYELASNSIERKVTGHDIEFAVAYIKGNMDDLKSGGPYAISTTIHAHKYDLNSDEYKEFKQLMGRLKKLGFKAKPVPQILDELVAGGYLKSC